MVPVTTLKCAVAGLAALGVAMKVAPKALDEAALDCCENADPPFESAVCYPFAHAGKCETVWINESLVTHAESSVNVGRAEALDVEKRLFYVRTDQHRRICAKDTNTAECLRRRRDAPGGDCTTLASFWDTAERKGFWVIQPRDLAGQNWLRLVQHKGCIFAVGNTRPSGNIGPGALQAHLGNLDIADAINEGVRACGPFAGEIEAEGRIACAAFSLGFLVTKALHCP